MTSVGEVLKIFSEREYSGRTRVRASEVCQGLPTTEREEKAGQILKVLKKAKSEEEFLLMMAEAHLITE